MADDSYEYHAFLVLKELFIFFKMLSIEIFRCGFRVNLLSFLVLKYIIFNSLHAERFFMIFLSSAEIFKHYSFQNILQE